MTLSNAQPVQFWPIDEDTFNDKEVDGITQVCFYPPWECSDQIIVQFTDTTGKTVKLRDGTNSADLVTFTEVSSGVYQAAFVPGEEGICDERIYLEIKEGSTVLAVSDLLDIRTTQECTKLITYANYTDFAGLVYGTVSPVTDFYLRIPAMLFRTVRPQEEEVHPLSDDTWVRVWSRVEKKMKLEIGFVPDYMHEKILLVLMHDRVRIDSLDWAQRDPYEKAEGNKRYPLERANVLLTDKEFIKRNLL